MKSLLCWEKHTSSFGRKCNESPLITLPETNRTKATENWWLEDDPGKEPIFRAELLVFGRVLCIISRPQHFQQVICPSVIKYDGDWGWPPFGKRCFNDQSWDIRVDFFLFFLFAVLSWVFSTSNSPSHLGYSMIFLVYSIPKPNSIHGFLLKCFSLPMKRRDCPVSEMGSFSRPWLGGKCHARWRPVGGWSFGA